VTDSSLTVFELALEALRRPADRIEMADLLACDGYRRSSGQRTETLQFTAEQRQPEDQPRFNLPEACTSPTVAYADWASISAVLPDWGRVLYRLARGIGGPILEIGTGSGLSAAYLAHGLQRAGGKTLTTIEPQPQLAAIAAERLQAANLDNVQVVEEAQDLMAVPLARTVRPKLVHIDSDHRAAELLSLLDQLDGELGDCLICLDDIRWSPGMERVWRDLVATHDTIDFHLWGLASRPPQPQQHQRCYSGTPPRSLSGANITGPGPSPPCS
jgi:predicted O-methyltransferase YrrM